MLNKISFLFLLTLLGALALSFSFPFIGGVFPLAFIALIPLFLFNFKLDQKEFKIKPAKRFFLRFGVNYLYFIIFNALTTWWIYYASDVGVILAIFANSLLMTLPFFLTGFITRQLGEGKGLFAILVLWLSFEQLHYFWELSWPWLNFGHILGTSPKLIQWYEYSGILGGSFWILFTNIILYILIRNIYIRKESLTIQFPNFLLLGLNIVFPIVSSLIIYYSYEEIVDPVDVVVVQPNIESHHEKFNTPALNQLQKLVSAAEPLLDEKVDLIVAPETAIPYGINEDLIEEQVPVKFLKEFLSKHNNIPLLIGASGLKFFDEPQSSSSIEYGPGYYENYNTALLLDPLRPTQVYHKAKLVLGGEKVPFITWIPALKEYSVNLGGASGILGVGPEPINFEASGVQFAPLICYESVYSDYTTYFTRKGADILCVITNDGWWKDTPGYKQHRSFSQIRAIENRRSIARSANTGISCFIDQRGEIISEIGWDEYGAIRETINKNTEFTFFVKYGNIIGRLALFIAIAMYLYAITVYFRKGSQPKKS